MISKSKINFAFSSNSNFNVAMLSLAISRVEEITIAYCFDCLRVHKAYKGAQEVLF